MWNRTTKMLILVLFAMGTGSVVCFAQTDAPSGPVVIGAILPMTGPLSYDATVVSRGLQMSVDAYNAARDRNSPEIHLVIEDNGGRTQDAINAFHKLVDKDKATAIVSAFTPLTAALKPLSEQCRVIVYATVTSVTDFAAGCPYVFRDFLSLPAQCSTITTYLAKGQGTKTIASLNVNDDYGRDAIRLAKETFTGLGGTWLAEQPFEQKDVDIRDVATKVIGAHPDTIFIVGRELSLANAIRAVREGGFKGQIACLNGFDSPPVLDALGSLAEGIVFTTVDFDLRNPVTPAQSHFVTEYQKHYSGEFPHQYALFGYVAGQTLSTAFKAAGSDPDRLKTFLESYNTQDLAGTATMNKNHDVARPIGLFRFATANRKRLEVHAP